MYSLLNYTVGEGWQLCVNHQQLCELYKTHTHTFRQVTDRKGKEPNRCRSSPGTWAPNWSCDLQAPGCVQRAD